MTQKILYFILLILILSSCVTNKSLNYLQPKETLGDFKPYKSADASAYVLRPGDELYIKIDPLYQEGSSAFQLEGNQRMTSQSAYYYTYPIYEDGTIDYPFMGKLKVADLTMEEARAYFIDEFAEYVEGFAVTVKLATNYINILGEVKRPGRVELTSEKINLFEAIALAGDLAPYGDRATVKVVRETKKGPIIKEFDMRRDDIIHSEYYWVQPGDTIYVSRIKGQFFKMDSFTNILLVFSTSLSLLLLAASFNN